MKIAHGIVGSSYFGMTYAFCEIDETIMCNASRSKIIDSPCMPEEECSIKLCAGGLTDSDD